MTLVPTAPITLSHLSSDEDRRRQKTSMQSLDIQSFTYQQRHSLLPVLVTAFSNSGGWVLDRRTLSSTNMEFRVEIQLRAALDLYAAIVATGVELTRSGHEAFTALCTCRKHLRLTADQIVTLRLEICFLEDITLHSLLAGSSALA